MKPTHKLLLYLLLALLTPLFIAISIGLREWTLRNGPGQFEPFYLVVFLLFISSTSKVQNKAVLRLRTYVSLAVLLVMAVYFPFLWWIGAGVTLVMAAQSMTEADTAWGRLESLVLCWGNLALAAGLMYATHQSFPKHLTWLWDSNLLVAAWIVLPLFVSLMSLFNVYGKKIDTV